MKKVTLTTLLLMTAFFLNAQVVKTSLNGIWQIQDSPKAEFQIKGEVPGTVFEALIAEKKIEDPFYGTNEKKMDTIFKRDWIYQREFNLTQTMLAADALYLCFDGIDTLADVLIDGQKVLEANNMHRAWKVDLKALNLKTGTHQLSVHIKSAANFALDKYKEYGATLMQGNACGIPGTPFTRKAWYSFGWDWGAQLPDAGIWKDCYLKAINTAEICNAQVITNIDFNDAETYAEIKADEAEIDIHLTTNSYTEKDLTAEAVLSGFGKRYTASVDFDDEAGLQTETLKLEVENPELWWIHELGTPALYDLKITLKSGNTVLDKWNEKIGIRKIELVQDKDKQGRTFYFRLNNVPVFAKGANWIPCDTFIPRGMKAGLVEKRLADAKAANFNFIRVWGGGIYETERFYNACDEMGLLVWQDFAFACYATPVWDEYYENVQQEVNENIIRLRNRPSLAIWVGNNEIEEAWKLWAYTLMFPQHKPSYDKIFNDIIPNSLAQLDPTRSYWPSSPHSDKGTYMPNDANSGDSHFWAVWHGSLPFSAYRKFPSRFMSEYGFESFPHLKTIEQFAEPKDYSFSSKVMENHQKNGAGNGLIMSYMKKQYSVPKTFEKQVIVSQITQAEAMVYGIDSWRARRHEFGSMGSLFWQFNDTWPVASWSSVDYYGRWKALQYFAKRAYSPLYCAVHESKKDAKLFVVNDFRTDEEITLNWSLQDVNGTVYAKDSKTTTAPASDSFLLDTIDIRPYRKGLSTKHLILFWSLTNSEGKMAARGFKLFDKPKFFEVLKPVIAVEVEQVATDEFNVTLTSTQNAIYTHFNTPYDFTASDNFFHLVKDEPFTINVKTWAPISKSDFEAGLKVESYYELLH